MKELQPNLLDDYEHKVSDLIARSEGHEGFPKLEDYRLTRKALDDYLYDYQIVLDREGSQRAQLTVYGIIAIFPTVVLSAFPEAMLPWGKWSLLVGVGIGVALSLFIKTVRALVTRAKLSALRHNSNDASRYVEAVMRYADEYQKTN